MPSPLRFSRLDRLSLGQKLFAMFALVLAFATVQSGYGLYELRQMNHQTHEMQHKWLPAVAHASDMNTHLASFRIAQLQRVSADTDDAKRAFDKELATVLEQFEESSAEFVKNISTEDQKTLHSSFVALWTQYLALHKKALAMANDNHAQEAKAALNTEMRPIFEQASGTLVTLVQINKFGAHQANEASAKMYAHGFTFVAASGALMMLVCSLVAWKFARSLSSRVSRASGALQAMSDGALDQDIAVTGQDEVGQLLAALQRLNVTLRNVVTGVRHNAEGVATASTRMLNDSNGLARRSEARAEAITETAATMAQLGETVRHNAHSAKQANLLAVSTSKLATDGGSAVGEVVATMKEINASSQRIAAIIGVIDGIAFQTNILALNAAVEAARAGEQGRGFAVVAAEVRVLAQRTAEAAREIKTLIHASVERVTHGSSLVDRAGSTMNQVVQSIGEVARMLGETASSSEQQSAGVNQVGAAVAQMDHSTQQDAQLVATGAEAARELQLQAHRLVASVAVFSLGEGSSSQLAPTSSLVAQRPNQPTALSQASAPPRQAARVGSASACV
jgi:methyl-accepting chemotaxis protein